MMGAGDGKLMALIAGYLGIDAGIKAIFCGMTAGTLWSLCRLRSSKDLKTRLIYLSAYFLRRIQTKNKEIYCNLTVEKGNHTLPLAAFMAVGTYLYLLFFQLTVTYGTADFSP